MELITFEQYITASGSHPERLTDPELTQELKDNASKFLETLNSFLTELGITKCTVTSGFRPIAVNAAIPNAAKKSFHSLCMACDILDDYNQTLAKKVLVRPDLLKKYGLWIEDPTSTIGKNTNWLHIDQGDRPDRPFRMFIP